MPAHRITACSSSLACRLCGAGQARAGATSACVDTHLGGPGLTAPGDVRSPACSCVPSVLLVAGPWPLLGAVVPLADDAAFGTVREAPPAPEFALQ